MIAGQPQPASGQACQRPDGSWQVTESAAGQPPQAYILPPGAIYANPYPAPYAWAGGVAIGLPFLVAGSVIFADAFHHFRRYPAHHHGYGHPAGRFHEGFHGERR
jgi:surface antigen